jgi:hypothetical protein
VGVLRDGDASIGDAILGVPVTALEEPTAEEPDAVVLCVDVGPERVEAIRARFRGARLLSLVGTLPEPQRTEG